MSRVFRRGFDGKIGIYPFVELKAAQRSSANRPKGTMEVKNIDSVNQNVFKKFLVEKVIPDIKQKWPVKQSTIFIQLDNARPHCPADDPDIVAAGTAGGWNIRLQFQPPKSPDYNVLDLGFFSSIQSLQYKEIIRNSGELVQAVVDSFWKIPPKTLQNTFLTLQKVLECSIQHMGGNQYKLPHVGKEKMRRREQLPDNFSCDKETYRIGIETLGMMENDKFFQKIIIMKIN